MLGDIYNPFEGLEAYGSVGYFFAEFLLIGSLLVSGAVLYRLQQALRRARVEVRTLNSRNYYSGLVADSTYDGLVVTGMDGKVFWCNAAYETLVGRPLEEIEGKHPAEFVIAPEDRPPAAVLAAFNYHREATDWAKPHLRRNRRADGSLFWNEMTTSFRTDPSGREVAVLVCRDVTERFESQQALEAIRRDLEFVARHDGLTGLANREAMRDFCAQVLDQNRSVGVLRIDCDRFREINETFGQETGDAVLCRIAKVLQAEVRESDLAARSGGDEFFVICCGLPSPEDLQARAASLAAEVAKPFRLEKRRIAITCTIGTVYCEVGDRTSVDDLLSRADLALTAAKKQRRPAIAAYDEAMHAELRKRIELGNDMVAAIQNGGFSFVFQPIYDASAQRITGFETLVRWNHPHLGMIAPDHFLPLAEELGLIAEIDSLAVDAALGLKVALRDKGFPEFRVGVNASSAALADPDYVDHLIRSADRLAVRPDEIVVEVLETVVLDFSMNGSPQIDAVARLHAHGFATYLDDFGIGHAGLAHLSKLRLTGVKIDRSLIASAAQDRAQARIVQAVCDLCGELGLFAVAEGIETAALAQTVTGMGCQYLQGYLISRPMTAQELLAEILVQGAVPLDLGKVTVRPQTVVALPSERPADAEMPLNPARIAG